MEKSDILDSLKNPTKASKGHYIASCPFCGKDRHFYINIDKAVKKDLYGVYRGCWDCKKCGNSGNIVSLLRQLGKLNLISKSLPIDVVENRLHFVKEHQELDISTPTRRYPVGFKRVYKDDYLESRRLTPDNYEVITFGRTELISRLKNYIIVGVEENEECKGYISRIRLEKEAIAKLEIKRGKPVLRYQNIKGFPSAKLLLGFDEITSKTDTAILVEGVFDKTNVDNTLDLYNDDGMKCLVTFGKKISEYQIMKLFLKGIKNIIILYDYDAINEMKKYSFKLLEYFNVYLTHTYKKDPGACTSLELIEVFNRLSDPYSFYIDKVPKKIKLL